MTPIFAKVQNNVQSSFNPISPCLSLCISVQAPDGHLAGPHGLHRAVRPPHHQAEFLIDVQCLRRLAASVRAQQPVLRFGSDKTFKIAQFTDMHLDPSKPRRLVEAEKTFARLDRILATERPDLVVFTGDVVTGKPAAEGWKRVLAPVAERNLPFCVVLGNHDAEQDLARTEIARIVTSYDGSLNRLADNGELADVELTVAGRGSDRPAWAFYCLDSHDYSTIEGIDGYGWFTQEQVGWYRAYSGDYPFQRWRYGLYLRDNCVLQSGC